MFDSGIDNFVLKVKQRNEKFLILNCKDVSSAPFSILLSEATCRRNFIGLECLHMSFDL